MVATVVIGTSQQQEIIFYLLFLVQTQYKQTMQTVLQHENMYTSVKSPTSDVIKSRYKQISNLVRSRTRQDTEAHVSNLSKQYFDSPKPFWRWLHSFKGNRSPIPPLLHNDENLTEDSNKAEAFNAYFSSVFTVDDGSDIPGLRESLSIHPSIIDSIQFTVKDVFEELISLQCDKACGPDLLPARLLKLGAEFLAPSLAQLFQLSLSSGKLPLDWVSANVVPVHKKGDKHTTSNYRPISLTSIVIKVMERIIHCKLVAALEQHNLLNDCQFGFRHKRSHENHSDREHFVILAILQVEKCLAKGRASAIAYSLIISAHFF